MKDFLLQAGEVYVTQRYLFRMMRAERWTGFVIGFLFAALIAIAVDVFLKTAR